MLRVLILFIAISSHLYLLAIDPVVTIFSTPQEVGKATAQKIADLIVEKKKEGKYAVIGLATGSTPIPVYEELKKIVRESNLDLSHVITFNLDEYLGLPALHPQSYRSFMFQFLFDELIQSDINPTGIKGENIHLPRGDALTLQDLTAEESQTLFEQFPFREGMILTQNEQLWIAKKRAQEYEILIEQWGPIDLQILGIGRNGHIGFAEPGISFSIPTTAVELSETTRRDNARFFDHDIQAVPKYAITMGIQTILRAKEIVLLATGDQKAEIIVKTLKGIISPDIPATALRLHDKVSFFLDEMAASHLSMPNLVKRFYHAYLLRDHQIQEGELWISNGKIIPPRNKADLEIDLQYALVAPGYIDLQINGGFGCDFSRDPSRIDEVAKQLPKYGVTAFLPTVISSTPDQYRSILPQLQPRSYQNKGAEILGIHLEGPYFSFNYSGCHDKRNIISSIDENSSLEKIYGNLQGVKMVTLAPEIQGALDVIKTLKAQGIVVAAGHSAASFEQMQRGIEAGVQLITHLFNAMPSFHHRNPSIIGSALLEPYLPYSLIADGVHLSPQTISLCWRCNPEGLILISDSIEALGLSNGKYKLGTMAIEVDDGRVYLAGTQTIAGSTLRLDQAVRYLLSTTQCSVVQALEAASLKPAQLIRAYPSKGTLDVGADADFVVLTDDLFVKMVYIAGDLYEENTFN